MADQQDKSQDGLECDFKSRGERREMGRQREIVKQGANKWIRARLLAVKGRKCLEQICMEDLDNIRKERNEEQERLRDNPYNAFRAVRPDIWVILKPWLEARILRKYEAKKEEAKQHVTEQKKTIESKEMKLLKKVAKMQTLKKKRDIIRDTLRMSEEYLLD